MVALKVVRTEAPGERVLPIFFGDSYVSLLPHEVRHISVELDPAELHGGEPKIVVAGCNVPEFTVHP